MVSSLLQTSQWAQLKEKNGWQAFEVEHVWVLVKTLPGGKSFLYAPEVEWNKIVNIITNIKNILEKHRPIFIRLEILDKIDDNIIKILKENRFIKSFEEVQPEWRQVINIADSEEKILAGMKQKGRYNIKVAQKHNVVIEKSTNINKFYEIFCQTAKRDGFEIRPRQYFEELMQILEPAGLAELWLARYNEKTIAAVIVTFYQGVASYLYGASSDEFRNLMAPYLLHWRVIQRAKEKGCRTYDLLAVAPEGVENHKYTGITRFKEQFGGEKIQIVGSWDLVFKPFWYKIFKIVENYRRK